MKIDTVRDAFLSDYEVLKFMTHLERRHDWSLDQDEDMSGGNKKRKRRPYNHPELQAITKDTIRYLSEGKGAVEADESENGGKKESKSPLTKLNDNKFAELMRQLNQFDLFKAEKLQIVNQLPTNLVHLYAIVEECDTRFSEEQTGQIIEAVQGVY
ncbi:LANO_0E15522g1_1 [Lachancea nothofagi CBS 11611]|uniref:DNA-directed RNA polymerase III subunit RPC9 n=1 Tax=Lachancea nothofagi CBS 11611 TaxID=1266666 RepID=A0A1G4K131_9SACH|nr:LANO_0E15522g1_1 [Lachancea nothofagi CBS 11611]